MHNLLIDLPFLPEKIKINGHNKLVCTQSDKKYVVHIRTWSETKKCLWSNCILSYIVMNTKLRKKTTNDFLKDLYKLMNYAIFGKTMDNIRRNRDIKLVTDKKKKM